MQPVASPGSTCDKDVTPSRRRKGRGTVAERSKNSGEATKRDAALESQSYAEFGVHVARILEAAEEAAARITSEAHEQAAAILRDAEDAAAARRESAAGEANAMRAEAEGAAAK